MTAAVDPFDIIGKRVGVKPAPPLTDRAPVTYLATAGTAYAQRALDAECERVSGAQPGERNHTLNRAAFSLGQLVAGGALAKDEVVHGLTLAAEQVGLERREIERTIDSGLKGGEDAPRGVPEQPDTEAWLASLPTIRIDPATGEVLDPPAGGTDAEGVPERTTWWPRELDGIIAGDTQDEPPPTFLARQDGHRLLYAGKVNALIGESESGKTWIGLLAALQTLQGGQRVLYLDFEDTAPGIVARLRLLGASTADLGLLAYIAPDEALSAVANRDLREHLEQASPSLIVLDGVNAAMTLLGLNLQDNMDATRFSQGVLRPLKRTGACVVTIDHVTKSKEGRGSYAIGAQAKRADIDGCALLVEVVQPFGKGMVGKLRLTVSKDRPGMVRAVSGGAKAAGVAHIDSSNGDRTALHIEAPDLRPAAERGPFRPTHLMQKVSELLETVNGGLAKDAIEKGVSGNNDAIRAALDRLVEEHYVGREPGARGALLHTSLRPFREDEMPTSPTSPDLAPTSPTGEVKSPIRPRPTPPRSMGGEGRGQDWASEAPSDQPDLARDLGEPDDAPEQDWWKR